MALVEQMAVENHLGFEIISIENEVTFTIFAYVIKDPGHITTLMATKNNEPLHSFIEGWLYGRFTWNELFSPEATEPDLTNPIWLALNHAIPFHEIMKQGVVSFKQARTILHRYLDEATSIVYRFDKDQTIETEDRWNILDALGHPPRVCWPIYIVTVTNAYNEERVVYVGKTISKNSRFRGGHSVAIKLLNPIYDGFKKTIYLGQIMFTGSDRPYLPLELVTDLALAERLLDDIETTLILKYQPELNSAKRKKLHVMETWFTISMENHSGTSFLHNETINNIDFLKPL